MDPSRSRVPVAWNPGMDMDDVYGPASMRRRNTVTSYGQAAGTFVPTPPSPEPEYQNYNHQPRSLLPNAYFDGQRPPTPPRHYQDNQFVDQHHCYDPRLSPVAVQPPRAWLPYTSPYAPSHGPPYEPIYGQVYHDPHCEPACEPEAAPQRQASGALLDSLPQPHSIQQQSPQVTPPVQLWPTENMMVDEETRQKQEKYRLKGEEARRRRSLPSQKKSRSSQRSADAPPMYPTPQLQEAHQLNLNSQRKRRSLPQPTTTPAQPSSSQHIFSTQSSFIPQPQQAYNDSSPAPNLFGQSQFQGNINPVSYQATFSIQEEDENILPARPEDPEEIYQPITSNYTDYKWPVKLYELRASPTLDFAQTYLDGWLSSHVFKTSYYTWHSHSTFGFIKNGNRLSILVLHNAANPFTAETTSSTSLGVYGRYAHAHNEIHWTTITPGISNLMAGMLEEGVTELKQKWSFNEFKASEKRFHRAYWLAANMLPLKGLLNNRMEAEKPHDAPEDEEMDGEEFEFTAEELQTGEENEEGEESWKKILDEVGGLSVDELGGDHVVTGGKEKEW